LSSYSADRPPANRFDLIEEVERVVVLVPASTGIREQQQDVERRGVVGVDPRVVLVHGRSICAAHKPDVVGT